MTTAEMTNTMTTTENVISRLQITAIIIMTAGWGWTDGNFTSGQSIWNMLIHLIPLFLLLGMSLQIFRLRGTHQVKESTARGAMVGMTVFAIVTIIACVVLVVLGIVNPDPNSVGVHNLWDWFPTIVLNIGTFLWLATLIPARLKNA